MRRLNHSFRVILLIILCCYSCSIANKDEYILPVFADSAYIQPKIIVGDTFVFSSGRVYGNKDMVVYNGMTDINENIYHTFDLNSGVYINSFGAIGRGPGEVLSLTGSVSWRDDNIFHRYDWASQLRWDFDLNKIGNSKELLSSSDSTQFPWPPLLVDHYLFLNDSLSLIYNPSGRFYLYNDTVLVDSYAEYPNIDDSRSKINITRGYFAYLAMHGAHPNGSMFVVVPRSGLHMEIFEISDQSILKLKTTKRYIEPLYDVVESERSKSLPYVSRKASFSGKNYYGAISLLCSDNSIYIEVANKTLNVDTPNEIWRFDWSGNPIKRYLMNDRISYWSPLPNDSLAVGLMITDRGPVLVKFAL